MGCVLRTVFPSCASGFVFTSLSPPSFPAPVASDRSDHFSHVHTYNSSPGHHCLSWTSSTTSSLAAPPPPCPSVAHPPPSDLSKVLMVGVTPHFSSPVDSRNAETEIQTPPSPRPPSPHVLTSSPAHLLPGSATLPSFQGCKHARLVLGTC